MRERTPVTIISGSLGAGKTTLVNHLLERTRERLAVLVNDMGEVNIDAALLESGSSLSREGFAELSNGCICCELRDDLESEVRSLARRYDFDHLVVEASGISEPAPTAQLFTVGDASARYTVDALVTVVDASLLQRVFEGERPERQTPSDAADRPLSDLLVEQIEVSNVVLLNKCDLVDESTLGTLEGMIMALQPKSRIHRTTFADIDPAELIGIDAFDPDELGELAGWQRAIAEFRAHRSGADHHDNAHTHRTPETVYGVTSATVSRHRPLDPDRFETMLRELPTDVIRLKGPCWIAGADDVVIQVSGAGPSITAEATGAWIATLPTAQRDLYRRNHPDMPWDDDSGDRRTELVLIGTNLDRESLWSDLEACFLDPDASVDDPAPFPADIGQRTVVRE